MENIHKENIALEKFIENERKYFQPMLNRQAISTVEQREKWRQENVHQRRARVSLEVYKKMHGKVQYGPFLGTKLKEQASWGVSDLGSMTLGLYEKEILNWLEDDYPRYFPENEERIFIDIGAADGYYAAGMLKAKLADKAICFEIDKNSRKVIRENIKDNKINNYIDIYGDVNRDLLPAVTSNRVRKAFVLCDIEGAEFDLLNDKVLSILKSSVVIIEVHHWVDNFQKKYEDLLRKASRYFKIGFLPVAERPIHEFREIDDLTDDNRQLLGSEGRPGRMRFLLLIAKELL